MGVGDTVNSRTVLMFMMHLGKNRYSGGGIMMFRYLIQRHGVGSNQKLKVESHRSREPRTRVQFLEIRAISLADVFWIPVNGETPKHRSWHTLTPIADDKLFLFGGLSADNIPLSDGWIYNVITNCWKQLTHLPKTRPRLWHTACLGKENEIMVFGGSKDDLLSLDTGHCNDLLIFQTQPYSLLRSCLDCIGKNAIVLESQISLLPPKLLQQVLKKITFWTAANHREEQRIQKEETENKYQWISSN
ncbi:kelch domain-containing protein 1 [Lynx pardinus]|uniref:Kelch domain-containing protein 1 n=1 Tax=Lynx pardinus TaxID=191816 RepID=A0A485NTB8_LYNPA|nr:kelch domain-containing protein 1 [Lynx pardinus]